MGGGWAKCLGSQPWGCWGRRPAWLEGGEPPALTPSRPIPAEEEESYLGVEVQLKREPVGAGGGTDSFLEWWVVRLTECPRQDCNILPMVIFNDKVSPPSLGFLAGYG